MSNNIGQHLKSLRKSKGLTLTQLEKSSGVSNSYLSQIENGHFKPSADVLGKLSKSLRVDFFELMVEAGYMTNESKEHGLDENFVTTMIKKLSIDDKKIFIMDFIYNSEWKYISRDNIFVQTRKNKIEELNKIGDINSLDENVITNFLIENFYIFGSVGDYLKLLRLHRGVSIEEITHELGVNKEEYIRNENSRVQGFPLLTENSEKIGFLLNVGDLIRWYSEQMGTQLLNKGMAKKIKSFSKGVSMQEDRKKKVWTFSIDYPMDNETINNLEHGIDDSEKWEKVSNSFFSIENLFTVNKNLSINNRLLTEDEKEKALQILQLVFKDTNNNSEEQE